MENPPRKPAKNDLPAEDPLDGEMPDIVDLVMEMGQPTPRVPAHVEDLVETAREYADNANSENTRDAYAKCRFPFNSANPTSTISVCCRRT